MEIVVIITRFTRFTGGPLRWLCTLAVLGREVVPIQGQLACRRGFWTQKRTSATFPPPSCRCLVIGCTVVGIVRFSAVTTKVRRQPFLRGAYVEQPRFVLSTVFERPTLRDDNPLGVPVTQHPSAHLVNL
jgi:hypothetical protein